MAQGRREQTAHDPVRDSRSAMLPVVNVLVVDDDEDGREMLAALIERAGYSVATACNGVEGLSRLRRMRPELILLDVCMPVMDGPTFRQEQRHHREWIQIPTAVMTGSTQVPTLDVAVVQTFHKPIRAAEVFELLRRYCTRV